MFETIKQLVASLPELVDFKSPKECSTVRKTLQQIKVEAQKMRKDIVMNRKNALLNKGN